MSGVHSPEGQAFPPLSSRDLTRILGLTIRRDEVNRLTVFLSQLSAFTPSSQLNVSFAGPSSAGKSFIPIEISHLFPRESVMLVGYSSPTAFFHEAGTYDKTKNTYLIDLSGKIITFLDQPHTMLLQHLRPLLSHDQRELVIRVTDRSQKAGLRTKNVIVRGFPAVIFCTAGMKLDEQEATRFILLSPETSDGKLREAIYQRIQIEANGRAYQQVLDENPERNQLIERIRAIREAGIEAIRISAPEQIEQEFLTRRTFLKPRHQRDVRRVMDLAKVFALLNLWHREREGAELIASAEDVAEAITLWRAIAPSQELGVPPYVLQVFEDVFVPLWREQEGMNLETLDGSGVPGLTRQDIAQKHFQVYERPLPDWQLRQQVLPMLEVAGKIVQRANATDKRQMLIYPTGPLTTSLLQNNSESGCGVNLPGPTETVIPPVEGEGGGLESTLDSAPASQAHTHQEQLAEHAHLLQEHKMLQVHLDNPDIPEEVRKQRVPEFLGQAKRLDELRERLRRQGYQVDASNPPLEF